MNQDQSKTDGAAPVSSTPLLAAVSEALSEEAVDLRNDGYRAQAKGNNNHAERCLTAAETLDGVARALNRVIKRAANDSAQAGRGKRVRYETEP
jgi:hypothetical protein